MPFYYRRFEIAGIVCTEPKVLKSKTTGVDNAITFSVAYNTKSGDSFKSMFYNITIYSGVKAFDNARYITRGQNIFCTGDIKRETWTKEVGGTKQRYEERVFLDCHDFRIITNKEDSAKQSERIKKADERKQHKYNKEDAQLPVSDIDSLPDPSYEYEDNNPDIPF